LPFPKQILSISLPCGPFELFVPVPERVALEYKALQQHSADMPFPYWSRLWPSAIALSKFIQHHPQLVAGKRVAELAAGVSLPSLVAATYAKSVWCSDISSEAMEVATQSAGMHQLENVQCEACSWSDLPTDFNAEVVLLSDINYDPDAFDELEIVLKRLIQRGCTLLLATPQRLLAKPFLEKLSGCIASSHEERVEADSQITLVSIFVLSLLKG
jgi:predicted nicotinamide N-methyase